MADEYTEADYDENDPDFEPGDDDDNGLEECPDCEGTGTSWDGLCECRTCCGDGYIDL